MAGVFFLGLLKTGKRFNIFKIFCDIQKKLLTLHNKIEAINTSLPLYASEDKTNQSFFRTTSGNL